MSQDVSKFLEKWVYPARDSLCDYFDGAFSFCVEPEPLLEKSHCEAIEENDQARELCLLLQEQGLKLKEIDTGLAGKIFNPPAFFAAPNGIVEAQEVYHKAIEVMEEEILSRGYISSEVEETLFSYKAMQAGFKVPWLIYDGDLATTEDEAYRQDLLKDKIDKLINENDCRNQLGLAEAIFEIVYSPDEFDFKVWGHLPRELDVQQTLLTRWGDCSELSRVFYTMYKYAGFSPRFVWVRKDISGNPLLHMAVAIECDGKEVIVDSHYGFNAKHAEIVDMPLLSSLAVYTNNIADQDVDDLKAINLLEQSLLYDPTFPLTYLYLSLDRFEDDLNVEKSHLFDCALEFDQSSGVYMNLIDSKSQSQVR